MLRTLLDMSTTAQIKDSLKLGGEVLGADRQGRPAAQGQRRAGRLRGAEGARHPVDPGRDGLHLEPRGRGQAARRELPGSSLVDALDARHPALLRAQPAAGAAALAVARRPLALRLRRDLASLRHASTRLRAARGHRRHLLIRQRFEDRAVRPVVAVAAVHQVLRASPSSPAVLQLLRRAPAMCACASAFTWRSARRRFCHSPSSSRICSIEKPRSRDVPDEAQRVHLLVGVLAIARRRCGSPRARGRRSRSGGSSSPTRRSLGRGFADVHRCHRFHRRASPSRCGFSARVAAASSRRTGASAAGSAHCRPR